MSNSYKKYWRISTMYNSGEIFLKILNIVKPKKFLEIGVFTGVNAMNICENLHALYNYDFKYVGLDLFEDYKIEDDSEILPNSIRNLQQSFSNPFKHFYYNVIKKEKLNSIASVQKFLKKYKKNVSLLKGNTKKTLKELDISNFDMVYVDGGHSFDTVYFELNYLLDNLKKNCFILCDDYLHDEAKGVKEAIDKTIRERNLNIKIYENRFASIVR